MAAATTLEALTGSATASAPLRGLAAAARGCCQSALGGLLPLCSGAAAKTQPSAVALSWARLQL